jgi:putative transposase
VAHLWAFSLVWLEPQYFSRENFMSGNYYSEINLHLIWHTKESLPLISDRIEPVLYRYIRQRIINTPGIFVHEIGGTETHIHVALIIQHTIQISDFVGQLKGASSHEINQKLSERDKILQWQSGYGVVSFGQGKIHERLERINAETQ